MKVITGYLRQRRISRRVQRWRDGRKTPERLPVIL